MTDDLFWPPLSGDDDDADRRRAGQDEHVTQPLRYDASEEYPTAAYPSPGPAAGSAHSRPRWTATATVTALAALIFGAGGVAIGAAAFHGNNNGSSSTASAGFTAAPASSQSLSADPKSYAGIAAKVLPSVVSINVTGNSESDTGSGVVLRKDGYILTNNHVVSAASSGGNVTAVFNDGSSASATIVGTDPLDDLAVIKVSKTDLTPAVLGSSQAVRVGDAVLAVGSPLGLTGTVTSGIVSALNRPVETQESQQDQNPFDFGAPSQSSQPTVIDAIQTDAAINPGNSGGPLVDADGQVIGINSAIATLSSGAFGSSSQSGSIGVGFAIPIDQAKTIAAELINTGHATHPLLGVTLSDTTRNGIDRATVHSVTSGSPADKAGLKAGDVITAVDGETTSGADAVIAAIRTHQPGQQIQLTYERGGSSKTVSVTLTSQTATAG